MRHACPADARRRLARSIDVIRREVRIEIAVAYRLDEYRQLLRDCIALDLAQRGETLDTSRFWNRPVVRALTLRLLVPLVFRWKMARVGDCVFVFDAAGLSRTSKGRTASRSWAQVSRVHRLSSAYLVELEAGGAMPLPFRCFTDQQSAAFDALIERVGLAPDAAHVHEVA